LASTVPIVGSLIYISYLIEVMDAACPTISAKEVPPAVVVGGWVGVIVVVAVWVVGAVGVVVTVAVCVAVAVAVCVVVPVAVLVAVVVVVDLPHVQDVTRASTSTRTKNVTAPYLFFISLFLLCSCFSFITEKS
jgi:hypothetical protein